MLRMNICGKIATFAKPRNVVRNPKTKFRSPSSDRTFNAKSLMGNRTLQHICKAHKTPTQSQPCKRAAIANTRQPVFSATDYRKGLINLQNHKVDRQYEIIHKEHGLQQMQNGSKSPIGK